MWGGQSLRLILMAKVDILTAVVRGSTICRAEREELSLIEFRPCRSRNGCMETSRQNGRHRTYEGKLYSERRPQVEGSAAATGVISMLMSVLLKFSEVSSQTDGRLLGANQLPWVPFRGCYTCHASPNQDYNLLGRGTTALSCAIITQTLPSSVSI